MTYHITFLHTSPVHIATFDQLLQEMAPDVTAEHIVSEAYLAEARTQGLTTNLRTKVVHTLTDAANSADVVICTCSTVGGYAQDAAQQTARPVLRVDQPMAERAVALGSRIIVAAAVTSTLEPTRKLILTAADAADKAVELSDLFCEGAWEHFEQGNQDAFINAIAHTLRTAATQGDVIVLAQASMAPAAELCHDLPIPVLSSPRLAIEHARQLLA